MEDKDKHTQYPWLAAAKERGFGGVAHVLLDVLEPIAPLAAQLLWIVQPVTGIFGARNAVRDLADVLETPNGVETLRQQLNANRTNDL